MCSKNGGTDRMYKKKDRETGELFSEFFPFGGRLDVGNRWLKISELVPWDELERMYSSRLSRVGRPASDARLVLGLLMLKHMTNLSDGELTKEFSENVYMQAFCGLEHFLTSDILDSSTLTYVRRRLGADFVREMESLTYRTLVDKKIIKGRGMLCDATVVPEKISYPNDVGLLEKCRSKVVDFVKRQGAKFGMKFRTYCRKAITLALDFSKKKNKTKKMIRNAKKKSLNFLSRNIRQAEEVIGEAAKFGEDLAVDGFETIKEICRQQMDMYKMNVNRIGDRIVSISRPYVRPIKRGKDGKDVEFGPKGAFSHVGGFLFLDHMSHDNFSEAGKAVVELQVKNFEKLFGRKPGSFTGDNLYGNMENRKFLAEKEIRAAFKPLGRKSPVKSLAEKRWLKKKHRERNRIEGAFGHGKEHGGLKPIRYKSREGSEIWIRLGLFGMNMKKAAAMS
jgi:hypothetical protein